MTNNNVEESVKGCPIKHNNNHESQAAVAGFDKCPVEHTKKSYDKCPVDHGKGEKLNPLTFLPFEEELSKQQSDTPVNLSTERVKSTIPRAESNENWMYPSNLMFYNALKRKGMETNPEDIDSVVQIHNFLNEQVWQEVLKWESEYKCECESPQLKRFMGKPHTLSPKAWFYSKIYGGEEPFDRHDWIVNRCGKEVRYVIDYYRGPSEHGMPSFYCDVRPSLDTFQNAYSRFKMFFKERFPNNSE